MLQTSLLTLSLLLRHCHCMSDLATVRQSIQSNDVSPSRKSEGCRGFGFGKKVSPTPLSPAPMIWPAPVKPDVQSGCVPWSCVRAMGGLGAAVALWTTAVPCQLCSFPAAAISIQWTAGCAASQLTIACRPGGKKDVSMSIPARLWHSLTGLWPTVALVLIPLCNNAGLKLALMSYYKVLGYLPRD